MSEKQFEESLDYGDCNNIICIIGSIFETTMGQLEKIVDKTLKS